VGFTLHYLHARNEEWKDLREYLRSNDVKVIHLKRRNLLDRYLSQQLAEISGEWVAYENPSEKPTEPVRLDPKECLKDFHTAIWFEQLADEFFDDSPKLEVSYEDLVDNPEKESRRLLDFLGVEFHELSAKTLKQQTKKRSEIIVNYDELKDHVINGVSGGWAKEAWLDFFEEECLRVQTI
jgi:LPS sulfotransferase NodH